MTPQKAINFIDNEVNIDVRFCSDEKVYKTIEVFELAKSALEKQIPKKVKHLNRHGDGYDLYNQDYFNCPSCGRRLRNKQKDAHCGKCGQALDWSDS